MSTNKLVQAIIYAYSVSLLFKIEIECNTVLTLNCVSY